MPYKGLRRHVVVKTNENGSFLGPTV